MLAGTENGCCSYPSIIPAVNYPTPRGLTIAETRSVVRALGRKGKLRVIEVAAYSPPFDPNASSADSVVKLLARIFA